MFFLFQISHNILNILFFDHFPHSFSLGNLTHLFLCFLFPLVISNSLNQATWSYPKSCYSEYDSWTNNVLET